ncbi:14481_t:CDS:2, partial [Cetraspora pellucida]
MGNPGAVYAIVVYGAKDLAHAMTITDQSNPDADKEEDKDSDV